MIIHKNIRLTGRVQGVGFRYAARSVAESLGISGYVRNMPNGDVYIEAEGTQSQVDDLIDWCKQGPPRANIRNIDVYDSEVVGYKEFIIR